jgi:hypothetical protein
MLEKANLESKYWAWLAAIIQMAIGNFLVWEHFYFYQGFDPSIGHEWIGLILIFTGMLTGLHSRSDKQGPPPRGPSFFHPNNCKPPHQDKNAGRGGA